jgi:hypothetical protein
MKRYDIKTICALIILAIAILGFGYSSYLIYERENVWSTISDNNDPYIKNVERYHYIGDDDFRIIPMKFETEDGHICISTILMDKQGPVSISTDCDCPEHR